MKPNKAKIDKRVDRVHSTNPLTLDKFLSGCEVTEVLAEINDNRAEITELICIYRQSDGSIHWQTTPIETERLVYMLDRVKHNHLTESDGEEDET